MRNHGLCKESGGECLEIWEGTGRGNVEGDNVRCPERDGGGLD